LVDQTTDSQGRLRRAFPIFPGKFLERVASPRLFFPPGHGGIGIAFSLALRVAEAATRLR